jgi:hypothetical protein
VLVAAGLAGLGVPYVLPAGLWVLAAASAVTFGQRVYAVRKEAAAAAAAPDEPGPAQQQAAAGSDTRGNR